MAIVAADPPPDPRPRWRPRRRLWIALALFIGSSVALTAITGWRDHHALLINASTSLPNWAFLIHHNRSPARGDYVFFEPPPSALIRRHFGSGPLLFGKRVLGMPGDTVRHWDRSVTINARLIAFTKPASRLGEPLAIGPSGVIPAGCYYVGTDHKDGFDSRYAAIGFICAARIVGTGEPIL